MSNKNDPAESKTRLQSPLVDENQAAEYLGVSARTLQEWRVTGHGPRFAALSARCVRYRLEDLDAFIESKLRTSTAAT